MINKKVDDDIIVCISKGLKNAGNLWSLWLSFWYYIKILIISCTKIEYLNSLELLG